MTYPAIKVCGLTRREDALAAAAAGASYLGVVLAPGGKRTVELAEAVKLLQGLAVQRAGVFVDAPTETLLRSGKILALDVLQLHGDETPEQVREAAAAGPWLVWKAVRIRTAGDFVHAAERFADSADGLLLDGWHPSARGGTGTPFPWEMIAEHRAKLPPHLSLVVAGGLRADNVAHACALLHPSVVDVSSGVEEAPGIKDADAIRAFVAAATNLNL
jgi:phosphoribosylanthranilate isomerase